MPATSAQHRWCDMGADVMMHADVAPHFVTFHDEKCAQNEHLHAHIQSVDGARPLGESDVMRPFSFPRMEGSGALRKPVGFRRSGSGFGLPFDKRSQGVASIRAEALNQTRRMGFFSQHSPIPYGSRPIWSPGKDDRNISVSQKVSVSRKAC
jgi:hypothetical protein